MLAVILRHELRSTLRNPFTWGVLALIQFLLAFQFLSQVEQFIEASPRLAKLPQPPGAAELIVQPLFGMLALLLLLCVPLLTMSRIAGERQSGTLALWQSAPVPIVTFVAGKWLGVVSVLLLPWLCAWAMPFTLAWGTALDFGALASAALGLLLFILMTSALGVLFSALTRQPPLAAVGTFAVLMFLWACDWSSRSGADPTVFTRLSLLNRFQSLVAGRVDSADLVYFVSLTAVPLALAVCWLKAERRGLEPGRWRGASLAALVVLTSLGAVGGALWLGDRHSLAADWTGNLRHTLPVASRAALAAVPGELVVTIWLPERHPLRDLARQFVSRYQNVRPSLRLRFLPPAEAPELMRELGAHEGDLVLASGAHRERVGVWSDTAMTSALARLARREPQWIAFVAGHGERSPSRDANFDLSDFARALDARGLKARELNLAEQGSVPDNAAVLVLASPQVDLLPGEITALEHYLARGGALLWLREPKEPASLAPLARLLGLKTEAVTIIDPTTTARGIDNPALTLVTRYGNHPALEGFRATVLLPWATPVNFIAPAGWEATELLQSAAQAWGESGALGGEASFDEKIDLRGPLPLAVALTRKQQRVVVVGDGDFLSNTYLGNGGNRELGIRLLEWLSANDALVNVAMQPAPDTRLELEPWQIAVIGGGFLFVLPGALVINGLWLWWTRRA